MKISDIGQFSRYLGFVFVASAALTAPAVLGGCAADSSNRSGEQTYPHEGGEDATGCRNCADADHRDPNDGRPTDDIDAHDADLNDAANHQSDDTSPLDASDSLDASNSSDIIDGSDGGAPTPQQFEAFFNIPQPDGTPDTILDDVLVDLLEQAAPGSQVYMALYTFSAVHMAEAFANAARRGVNIKVVLANKNKENNDSCTPNEAVQIMRDALGDDLTICRECQSGGCIGTTRNHNKFILFSELIDGSRNVVVQSSANLAKIQTKVFNNLVVIRDDPTLYDAYLQYWQDLKAQRQDPDYYWSEHGDTPTRVYFFPRKTGDTIISALNGLDCPSGGKVHIAMAFFQSARVNIAQKLADMQRQGCQVQVLISDHTHPTILSTLRAGGASVKVYERINKVSIHSKYLLIDGIYNGNPHKLVWTGSHNYNQEALRSNDETLLKINVPHVYDAFLQNWHFIDQRIDELP